MLGWLSGGLSRTILFTASYGGLWFAYAFVISRFESSEFSRRSVLLWAALFTLLLLPMPPHFSDDIIGYAQYGRVLVAYKQNPYIHTLSEFGDSWAVYRRYWAQMPSPYGPIMTLLLAGAVLVGADNLFLTVGVLKLLMAGCYLLSGWLIGKIMDVLNPSASAFGMLFFLWNPMVLLELVGQGHNESVMIALMLLGMFFLTQRKHDLGFLSFLLSALTKFTTAIVLPLYIRVLLRIRVMSTLLRGILVSMFVVGASYLTFFPNAQSLRGVAETTRLNWLSLTWLCSQFFIHCLGWEAASARTAIQIPILSIFLIFWLWRTTKVTSEARLVDETARVLIFFLLVVPSQMNTWYLTPMISAVAIAMNPLRRSIVLVVSLWPLVVYFRPPLYVPPLWANIVRSLLFLLTITAVLLWHLHLKKTVPATAANIKY